MTKTETKTELAPIDPSTWDELPQIVLDEGYPLEKTGRSWAGNKCPRCGESSDGSNKFNVFCGKDYKWRFNCFAGCGAYGDAADFLALARNITQGEAISLLNGHTPRLTVVRAAPEVRRYAAELSSPSESRVREVIAILKEKALDPGPRAYLTGRGISNNTIDMAVATGQLRMLPSNPEGARRWLEKHVGESLMREAGLMKRTSKWPALAFKPILALEPGGFGFECRVATKEYEGPKAIRYGRMKWPWYFKHTAEPSTILIAEGIIDGLSSWEILPEAEGIMSVPGVNGWSPRWFAKLKELKNPPTILLGFDEDKAGQDGNDSLEDYLDTIGLDRITVRPPLGKDWNDALKAMRGISN